MIMMTARETAEMLRVTTRTLASWRAEKTGPPWYKMGKSIRYKRADIETWLEKRKQLLSDVKKDIETLRQWEEQDDGE